MRPSLVMLAAFILVANLAVTTAAGNDTGRVVIDVHELEALVDRVMSSEMQDQQIPGAAFIMVQNGRVLFEKGYGLADIARSKRFDPKTTIFPIA